jgi:transposase
MNYVTGDFFNFKGYKVNKVEKDQDSINVFLIPRRKTAICPKCGKRSKELFSNGEQRIIKHSKYENKLVNLSLPKRRFACKNCNKPFSEKPEFIEARARATNNFTLEAVYALSKASFSTVCEVYHTSHSFLSNNLKKLNLDKPWPKGELRLGFDEHSYAKRKMMITVTELGSKTLLAILPSYSRQAVMTYLDSKTEEELSRVVELCFDMKFQQRRAVQEYFPGTPVTIDKFHVLFRLAYLIDADRRFICPGLGRCKYENLSQAMRKPIFKLDQREKEYLDKMFAQYPELKVRWNIYQKLVKFYGSKTKDEGRVRLRGVQDEIRKLDKLSYLRPFANTLKNLEVDILNYFDNRTTNAFTEGVHTKIKMLKRTSYGFKNPEIYIKKMMLAFLPFAIISLLLPH